MESTYGEDKSRSDFSFSSFLLGSFGNDDGDGNENVKKAIGLLRKQLCTYITLFCTFLCRHCTTTTWKCLIHVIRRTWTSDDKFFFLFLNLSAVAKKSTLGKLSYIWHFLQIRINATKFEETRIHFKSDVLTAVAVVDAKATYWL